MGPVGFFGCRVVGEVGGSGAGVFDVSDGVDSGLFGSFCLLDEWIILLVVGLVGCGGCGLVGLVLLRRGARGGWE